MFNILTPLLILWLILLKLRGSLARINPAVVLVIVVVPQRTGPGLVPEISSLPPDLIVINLHPVCPHGNTVETLARSVGYNKLSIAGQLVPVGVWTEIVWYAIGESDRGDLNKMFDLEQVEPN